MILYVLRKNTNIKSAAYGKYYAFPVIEETIDLDALSEHMANHNTPYSKGAIKGVLTDMVNCIKELLLEGKNVKIEDLARYPPRNTLKFRGSSLLAGHQEQRRCRQGGELYAVEAHQGREVPCPRHGRTGGKEPQSGGFAEESLGHYEGRDERRQFIFGRRK